MNSIYVLFGIAAVILAVWGGWSLRNENIIEYFKTDRGKGILKGIVLATAFLLGAALISNFFGCAPYQTKYGNFNNGATVYAGLDWTKKSSPMCEDGGTDDHSTSNLGLRWNMYETTDGKVQLTPKYTHHSCAFGVDDRQYDAGGLELSWKLY